MIGYFGLLRGDQVKYNSDWSGWEKMLRKTVGKAAGQ